MVKILILWILTFLRKNTYVMTRCSSLWRRWDWPQVIGWCTWPRLMRNRPLFTGLLFSRNTLWGLSSKEWECWNRHRSNAWGGGFLNIRFLFTSHNWSPYFIEDRERWGCSWGRWWRTWWWRGWHGDWEVVKRLYHGYNIIISLTWTSDHNCWIIITFFILKKIKLDEYHLNSRMNSERSTNTVIPSYRYNCC